MRIGQTTISKTSEVYFIADIASNHDGDLERAIDLIFLAAQAGADAVKFQHFAANSIVSDRGFKSLDVMQATHQSTWSKTVYEVFDEASVDLSWTLKLVQAAKDAGVEFMTTPYSFELADQLAPYVPAFKIGSGDITWIEFIQHVARQGLPYMLATGASSMNEVEQAVDSCLPINSQLVLMQCNTNYTGSLENFSYINLNVLKAYAERWPQVVLGLSDHTPGHSTVLGAVVLGARVIEKHFTDSNDREGPDHMFSMNPETWENMVEATRELESALGDGVKRIELNEESSSIVQRRCLRASRNIASGEILTSSDISILRPCPQNSLPPSALTQVIGKQITKDLQKGDCISF